jgi:hypothetical protein
MQRKVGYEMENEVAEIGRNFLILIKNIDKDITCLRLRRNKKVQQSTIAPAVEGN